MKMVVAEKVSIVLLFRVMEMSTMRVVLTMVVITSVVIILMTC